MHTAYECLWVGITLVALVATPTTAQPSGGPYGPIRITYDIPEVPGKIYFVAPGAESTGSGESLDRPTTLESAIERVRAGDAIVLRGLERAPAKRWKNALAMAEALVAGGAVPDVPAPAGGWPLHAAAEAGDARMAAWLLDHGAKPGAAAADGVTALHLAARLGHRQVSLLLLARGADPTLPDAGGKTPVAAAEGAGHLELARVLAAARK